MPARSPRLVASDLDGTLLQDGAVISPRVTRALARAQASGVVVVLVTARNWRSVAVIAGQAGVQGKAICSNGAIVYDVQAGAVHHAYPIDLEVLRPFVSACTGVDGVCIGWETALGAYRTQTYQELAARDRGFSPVYTSAIEILDDIADDHQVTKVLVRHPTMRVDELMAELAPVAAGLALTTSGGPFVEVSRAGITKAHTLELLCDELGIAADEVVAVGDQPNDLPMLEWAGRGVAMGNSHPAVLAAMEEHTAANTEDGLALVLESLVDTVAR